MRFFPGAALRNLWKRLPEPLRKSFHTGARNVGAYYVADYFSGYDRSHAARNFAGNLECAKAEYREAIIAGRDPAPFAARIFAVIDNLVLKNGVTKTTYPHRLDRVLSRILDAPYGALPKRRITVLDAPSSIGSASLGIYSELSKRYEVGSYVLGDLSFAIRCDHVRGLVFDEEGELLQVRLEDRFFSLYRPRTSGDEYRVLAPLLMAPLDVLSWYFRRRHRGAHETCDTVSLLHPDVEDLVSKGVFRTREVDVFAPVREKFDVVVCFNLLVDIYFPPPMIRAGIDNLGDALEEGGLLIVGGDKFETFTVWRKRQGKLVEVASESLA